MKKLYLLALTVIFCLTDEHNLTAQIITAGSIPSGMYTNNPNVNVSVTICGTDDSASFDINCDNIADMQIKLHKGYTVVDGANSALLFVLNDTIEMSKDTGNFSGWNGILHYYNFGDTLTPAAASLWSTDTLYQFGYCGCMGCVGPCSENNMYIAYRKASQIGWIKISFNLSDMGSCTVPITVSIPSVLAPCSSIGVEQLANKTKVHINPNPFSAETVLRTDNLLHNATLTVDNCFGQTVKQIKNINGHTVLRSRENLASGLYFFRLKENNKTIAVDKLVITDN